MCLRWSEMIVEQYSLSSGLLYIVLIKVYEVLTESVYQEMFSFLTCNIRKITKGQKSKKCDAILTSLASYFHAILYYTTVNMHVHCLTCC